ncbi:putative transcription factor WD40-like family [Dioscorea sansibarensis]
MDSAFHDTAHTLERESGLFFNVDHLETLIVAGDWEAAERYISGFTSAADSRTSMQLFFEIRKQKYLEALDDRDHSRACSILRSELQPFSDDAPDVFSELTLLLTKENFREKKELAKYGDAKMSRAMLVRVVRRLVEANPLLRDRAKPSEALLNTGRETLVKILQGTDTWLPSAFQKSMMLGSVGSAGQKPCTMQGRKPNSLKKPALPGQETCSKSVCADWLSACPLRPSLAKPLPPRQTHSKDECANGLNACPVWPSLPKPLQLVPEDTVTGSGSLVQTCQTPELPLSAAIALKKTGSSGISKTSIYQLSPTNAVPPPPALQAHDPHHTAYPEASTANAVPGRANQAAELHKMVTVAQLFHPSPLLNPAASHKHIQEDGLTYFGSRKPRHTAYLEASMANAVAGGNNQAAEFHKMNTVAQLFHLSLRKPAASHKHVQGDESFAQSIIPTFERSHGIPEGCEGQLSYRLAASRWRPLLATEGTNSVAAKGANSATAKEASFSNYGLAPQPIIANNTSTPMRSVTPAKRSNIALSHNVAHGQSINFTQACKRQKAAVVSDMPVSTVDIQSSLSLSSIQELPGGVAVISLDASHPDKSGSSCTSEHISPASTSIATQKSVCINSKIMEPELHERCELVEIGKPSACHSLSLPDSSPVKVVRLIYSHSGDAIWALASNGINKLWQWKKMGKDSTAKADVSKQPQLKTPSGDKVLANELSGAASKETLHWFALSNNDSYLMSVSGGSVSLYNAFLQKQMTTFKIFMGTAATATCFVFLPKDNNIIVVGMEDSTIIGYETRADQVRFRLTGHTKRVNSLTLSGASNLLVSSGEDFRICIWNLSEVENSQKIIGLKLKPFRQSYCPHVIKVKFHPAETHFLAVSKIRLSVYEASKLKHLYWWTSERADITDAAYSSDGLSIYCSCNDGNVIIFSKKLAVKCRISCLAYLHKEISSNVFPLAIAAHPKIPYQFALGLCDGGVRVLEPLESGEWGGKNLNHQNVVSRRCYSLKELKR